MSADERLFDGPPMGRAEFWQKVASVTFGIWAIMLPLAAAMVIGSVSKFTDKFDQYVLVMEKRVTLLEERQSRVLRILEDQDARLGRVEERGRSR